MACAYFCGNKYCGSLLRVFRKWHDSVRLAREVEQQQCEGLVRTIRRATHIRCSRGFRTWVCTTRDARGLDERQHATIKGLVRYARKLQSTALARGWRKWTNTANRLRDQSAAARTTLAALRRMTRALLASSIRTWATAVEDEQRQTVAMAAEDKLLRRAMTR